MSKNEELIKKDLGAETIKRLTNEFIEFVNEFKGESDRAAVILGAAKIDQLLGLILEKFLIPCSSSNDELFENNGPLGTFSAKINLCYRLGLIDDIFSKTIHLIRRIRNGFAHEIYGSSLSCGSHKDRVKALVAPLEKYDQFQRLRQSFFNEVCEIRADFSTALGLIIVRLSGLHARCASVDRKQIQTLLQEDKQLQQDDNK